VGASALSLILSLQTVRYGRDETGHRENEGRKFEHHRYLRGLLDEDGDHASDHADERDDHHFQADAIDEIDQA